MATSTSTSRKRKIGGGGETKYYAVRFGKVPGVYTEWEDCQKNTTGFKGAVYKSFFTLTDAQAYVAGKNPSGPSDLKAGDKFYGVAVGHVPGVYTQWTDCQEQILNVKGPKYKKFPTRQEAEEWVLSFGGKNALKADTTTTKKEKGKEKRKEMEDDEGGGPAAKKVRTANGKGVAAPKGVKEVTKVYTDGSALGNGKFGASAGVGVYFGENDSRNISLPLPGPIQTNQRAELHAILLALRAVPASTSLEILTDSQYSINCLTVWYKSWVKNAWKKSDGGAVVNRDLVEGIRIEIEGRAQEGGKTEFTWVKGHEGHFGNERADRLAVAGAQRR